MTSHSQDLLDFAAEIGTQGGVVVCGGKTQWEVGGPPDGSAREVAAPAGVRPFEPEDMVVRCGAGTTLAELSQTLAKSKQMVPFDLAQPELATVGGALAVGRSGWRRLRYGPIRDFLLELTYVDCQGQLIRSGGPTVKNVSGYDLCRLMVGSLGTLGCLGEVVLRCCPEPKRSGWFVTAGDPFGLLAELWQPASLLWDGNTTWVLLEGEPDDIVAQARRQQLKECTPDELPDLAGAASGLSGSDLSGGNSQRISVNPALLNTLPDHFEPQSFLAEVGVGIVHLSDSQASPPSLEQLLPAADARSLALQREIKSRFDPEGRLNPGRSVWGGHIAGSSHAAGSSQAAGSSHIAGSNHIAGSSHAAV